MRFRLPPLPAVLLFFLAGMPNWCVADAGGPTVLDKGYFSYQAPPGWTVTEFTSSPPVALGPMRHEFRPTIRVDIKPNAKPMRDFVADNLRAIRAASSEFRLVDQQTFATAAGLDGIRVITTNTTQHLRLQQILYFFDVGSNQALVISATCLAAEGPGDAPIFDASIKTFSLE